MASKNKGVTEHTEHTDDARTRAAKAIMEIVESKGGLKPAPEEKSYENSRSLGQIHVTLDGRSYGFNIMVFDYGVKLSKKEAREAVTKTEQAAADALGISVEEFRAKYVQGAAQ